jgi:hypothetical protein
MCLERAPVELDVGSLPALEKLRVRSQPTNVLDVDAEPVRALARDLVQERGEPTLEPRLDDACLNVSALAAVLFLLVTLRADTGTASAPVHDLAV